MRKIIVIFKPKQFLKLMIVLLSLTAISNVMLNNLKPQPIQLDPKSEPPEIQRGEYLSWEEVDKVFYRYANATVVDLETGLSFRVQRRAGSSHADVQPLTAKDTAVMRVIYNGQWSWQRRAVVVDVGGRRLAGSMNGMPHGAGAIRGNDFNGHFCIHFRDSKVHQSGKEDLAHQMMICKSAGRFKQMVSAMGPEEVIEVLFTALDQQDMNLALKTLYQPNDLKRALLKTMLTEIARFQVQRIRPEGKDIYWVYLTVRFREGPSVEKRVILKAVDLKDSGWRINSEGLEELLNRKTHTEILNSKGLDEGDCD